VMEHGVILHDVPEDGHPADGDHRLGHILGHIADARPEPAAKDHCFHEETAKMPGSAGVLTVSRRFEAGGQGGGYLTHPHFLMPKI
jgi:hypothetical protein